jgi:hypothetical protein
MYVENPQVNNAKFLRKFRRRFRLPHDKFVELVEIAKQATDGNGNLYFQRWMSADDQESILEDGGGTRIVRKLSQTFSRQRLVEHFDIV